MLIDLDIAVDITYQVDIDPPDCKHTPITITAATFRGKDILNLMHVGHIMQLQRRVYNRLLDSGMIIDGVYSMEPSDEHIC